MADQLPGGFWSVDTVKAYAAALWVAAGLIILAVLWPRQAITPEEQAAVAEGRIIINYWDRNQGHEFEMRTTLIDEFNRSQSEIFVRPLSIGWRIEKLLTAITGGAPPDICSIQNDVFASLASQDCFMDLDDWMRSKDYLHPDGYFPHILAHCTFEDRLYAIPTMTDSYCLLWNKSLFRKAGLDPERPPRTMKELEEYAAKLTTVGPAGIETIGFLPWVPWDHSFGLGGVFGGTWYDPETDKVVCGDSPGIIESYRWQASWQKEPGDPNPPAHALDQAQISSFFAGSIGGGAYFSATNPFYSGRIAMTIEGEWQCTFIPKYAPNLDWGVAAIPTPEGVTEPKAYAPGCVLDVIPANAPNPEAAKKYLEWFYSPRPDGRPSPASDFCHLIHNIPTRPEDARQARFVENEKFKVFVDQLIEREAVPIPPMPASAFYISRVEAAREWVLYDGMSPEDAVARMQREVQAELERIRTYLKKGDS